MDRLIYWLIERYLHSGKKIISSYQLVQKNDNDVPQLTDYLHFNAIPLQ